MFGSIDSNLKDLQAEFSQVLSNEILIDIQSFIDAREWEMALEELCFKLLENKVNINETQYQKIESVGVQMKMKKKCWEMVKPLIKNY